MNYPEYYEYADARDIEFKYLGSVPWNCMDPKLVARGNKMRFVNQKGNLITTAENVDGIENDKIDVMMRCSSVYYRCEQFNVAQEQRALGIGDENDVESKTTH